jgi:hypothetical protein
MIAPESGAHLQRLDFSVFCVALRHRDRLQQAHNDR